MAQESASELEIESATRDDRPKEGGCFGSAERNRNAVEKNHILNQKRGCCGITDGLFTLLYVCFFFGMIYVFAIGAGQGNVNRLLYGSDWAGEPCGDPDSGNEDRKHQYWPNPLYYSSMGSVCLDECPGAGDNHTGTSSSTDVNGIICVCNNDLTIDRNVGYSLLGSLDNSNVANSLCGVNSTSYTSSGTTCPPTNSFLNAQCSATTCDDPYNGCDKRGNNWVHFDLTKLPTSYTQMPTMATLDDLSSTLYYYMPEAWMTTYSPTGTNLLGQYTGKYMVPNCMYTYKTYVSMNRCIPSVENYLDFGSNASNIDEGSYSSYMNSYAQTAGQAYEDCLTCFWVIVGSFGIACVLGFVYIAVMEECAGCVVWTVIITSIVCSCAITGMFGYFCTILQARLDVDPQLSTYDTDQTNLSVCLAFTVVFGVISLVIFCAAICLRKQIMAAVEIVKIASDAFLDFPYLILYPVVQIAGLFLLLFFWTIGGALIASSGDQVKDEWYGTHSWDFNDTLQNMLWYWLFGLLWTGELMIACGIMIVSACFAQWFFSYERVVSEGEEKTKGCCGKERKEDAAKERDVPSWPLIRAMKLTYINHFGTACFGSLIMAVIDFIRIIVEYIDRKQKELAGGEDKVPWWWDCVFKIMRSCLACLDCCMRYLTKNAYNMTIIQGTGLCKSGFDAFWHMLNNMALFAILCGVQAGIFFFAKLAITLFTGLICALIIEASYKDQISSILLPTFVCMLIGYVISSAFVCVYDMGIDTMLLCYAEVNSPGENGGCCSCCDSTPEKAPMHIPSELTTLAGKAAEGKEYDEAKKNQELRQSQTGTATNQKTNSCCGGKDKGEESGGAPLQGDQNKL